jgi:hypothetical protein
MHNLGVEASQAPQIARRPDERTDRASFACQEPDEMGAEMATRADYERRHDSAGVLSAT